MSSQLGPPSHDGQSLHVAPSSHSAQRRLALLVLAGCCVILAGWIVVLAATLPHRFDVHHWRGVWVGFDIFLLAALVSVAWAAWRERQVLILLLMILGTMLCCDAWFDVGTAVRKQGLDMSLFSAVFAEIPLAIIAFAGARRLLRATVRVALDNQPAQPAAPQPAAPQPAAAQPAAAQPAAAQPAAAQQRHLLRVTPLFGGGLEGALPHRRRPRPGLDQ
jgi:hypothetical protein